MPSPRAVLTPRPLTEPDARAVAAWRYPAPYDCYDFPPWADLVAQGWAIASPARRAEFTAVDAAGPGSLVGWFWLRGAGGGDVGRAATLFSCGLAPDACGHGLGAGLVDLAVAQWSVTASPLLELWVRPFNRRAITVYERAGFTRAEPIERAVLGERVEHLRLTLRRP